MTESSSKGLTWATLVAGVASALVLAVIGCVKPIAADNSGDRLRSGAGPSPEPGAMQRFVSQESTQRSRADNRPAANH